jgi:choline dehydrogenase-like flavoprotein
VKRTELDIAAFHPLGTCRMAADPDRGVVDENGEVHGVRNLFIADGSIFPSSLGVNPQETIMAFANRIADFIEARRL